MSETDEAEGANPENAEPDGAEHEIPGRLRKSPSAFRTISEVADELHIPQHVLRFWETRFPQVKPLKRGGGRRYYRPDDIALLRSISHLLYIQGYTIKGVQRLLREGGGALADDIPPASETERAENEGAVPHEPPAAASDADDERDAARADAPAPAASAEGAPAAARDVVRDEAAAAEIARLRAALRDVLAELEAIRALIPG